MGRNVRSTGRPTTMRSPTSTQKSLQWSFIPYNVFGSLVITRVWKNTFLGMDIELLKNNKHTVVMKSYIQEAIVFYEDMSKSFRLHKIKMCTKLIQTPLHHQISRQDIFIPLFQNFYRTTKYWNYSCFIWIHLSHQRNKAKRNSRECYSF